MRGFEYLSKSEQKEVLRLTRELRRSYTSVYGEAPKPEMTELHVASAVKKAAFQDRRISLSTLEKASSLMSLAVRADSLYSEHHLIPIIA